MMLKPLAAACLVLIPLAACDRERSIAPAARPAPASAAPSPAAEPAIPEFSLTLPQNWSGRYRLEKSEGEAARNVVPEALQVVEYLYQPTRPELPEQPLLMVIVLKQDNWQSKEKAHAAPLGEVLARRDGYVYVAALPQGNPYGKTGEDAQLYDQLRLDPGQVKAGFALPQG